MGGSQRPLLPNSRLLTRGMMSFERRTLVSCPHFSHYGSRPTPNDPCIKQRSPSWLWYLDWTFSRLDLRLVPYVHAEHLFFLFVIYICEVLFMHVIRPPDTTRNSYDGTSITPVTIVPFATCSGGVPWARTFEASVLHYIPM